MPIDTTYQIVYQINPEHNYLIMGIMVLVPALVGVWMIVVKSKRASATPVNRQMLGGVGLLVVAAWIMQSLLSGAERKDQLVAAMRTGAYETVTGEVTDYVAANTKSNGESFTVAGHHYAFGGGAPSVVGFSLTRYNGSPIRQGKLVRIAEARGQIGRLEVALPTPAGSKRD